MLPRHCTSNVDENNWSVCGREALFYCFGDVVLCKRGSRRIWMRHKRMNYFVHYLWGLFLHLIDQIESQPFQNCQGERKLVHVYIWWKLTLALRLSNCFTAAVNKYSLSQLINWILSMKLITASCSQWWFNKLLSISCPQRVTRFFKTCPSILDLDILSFGCLFIIFSWEISAHTLGNFNCSRHEHGPRTKHASSTMM